MVTIKSSLGTFDRKNAPVDDKLPGLATLFAAEQVEQILKSNVSNSSMDIANCVVLYVRYKPATNCIVSYSVQCQNRETGEARDVLLYGKCYTEADYFQATSKAAAHRFKDESCLRSVVTIPEIATIFFVFPNDSELDGLPTVFNSRKLTRYLYEFVPQYPRETWRISDKRLRATVVRYKPEKRAVVRVDTRVINRTNRNKESLCIYVRTYGDRRGEEIFERMSNLSKAFESHRHVKVPRALAYIPDKKLLLVEGLEGESLLQKLQEPDKLGTVARAAEALAILHKVGGKNAPRRSTTDLLLDARSTGNTLANITSEICDDVEQILSGLGELDSIDKSRHEGFVHGDFYYGQVLLSEEEVVILDFDRSYFGETLADVGNFCAHLILLSMQKRLESMTEVQQAFVEAYVSASGNELDQDRLRLWTAFGLLQLSVHPFRSFEDNWMAKTTDILNKSRGLLC